MKNTRMNARVIVPAVAVAALYAISVLPELLAQPSTQPALAATSQPTKKPGTAVLKPATTTPSEGDLEAAKKAALRADGLPPAAEPQAPKPLHPSRPVPTNPVGLVVPPPAQEGAAPPPPPVGARKEREPRVPVRPTPM